MRSGGLSPGKGNVFTWFEDFPIAIVMKGFPAVTETSQI
jgi:hypothetical protein